MAKLEIKYRAEGKALPPRPIRVAINGWGGSAAMKKEDGSQPQPWHCPLFAAGCMHGVELIYQYEQECHVVNENGNVRIIWDYTNEPGGGADQYDFTLATPFPSANYLFMTSLDIQAPPGYLLRTEPHPRFYFDTTGSVPAAIYGHVSSEWWPKKLFIVFKAPGPGERHVFRKGEPYVQILFVPNDSYEVVKMTPDEHARRRKLESDIKLSKSLLAKHVWHSADGVEFNDHYKVLEKEYERGGLEAVERTVAQGIEQYRSVVPEGKTPAEYLDLVRQYHEQGKTVEAKELLLHLRKVDPNNAEVLNRIGMLEWDIGLAKEALRTVRHAVMLQPNSPKYLTNFGKILRHLGHFGEAEKAFAAAWKLQPGDPEILSNLGLAMAQAGNVAGGLEACRSAAAMTPRIPAAPFRMAMILARMGRRAEARAALDAALAIDPDYEPARRALESAPPEAGRPPQAPRTPES